MSANTWYAISLTGFFAALVLLIVTLVLFFKLDILDVIGDLTGRTVAREIKSMRENRNSKGQKAATRTKYASKSSASGKSSKTSKRSSLGGSAAKTDAGSGKGLDFSGKRAKNGTVEMSGRAYQDTAADKRVLHSKTDKLSRDTEELYEDFDPRVEYSRTDILEETETQTVSAKKHGTSVLGPETGAPESKPGTAVLHSGTEVLKSGTEVLKPGTEVLPHRATAILRNGTVLLEDMVSGGTTLLTEDMQMEPVKFSITRSYLVVHSEESIG